MRVLAPFVIVVVSSLVIAACAPTVGAEVVGVTAELVRLAGVRDALRGLFRVGPESGIVAGFAPFALLGPAFGCRTASPDMDVTRPATLTATGLSG